MTMQVGHFVRRRAQWVIAIIAVCLMISVLPVNSVGAATNSYCATSLDTPPTCPSGSPIVVAASATGYVTTASGAVYRGGSSFAGMNGRPLDAPIVGITDSTNDDGSRYWLVGADGGVFAFGSPNSGLPQAEYFGSMGGRPLNAPIVGIASSHDSAGYWLVASDGGVFSFGDAPFYGSMGGRDLREPIVGMTVTPDGGGYWLVASDGGVFSFGDAPFYGSLGSTPIPSPVVGMASLGGVNGYWLVASNGSVYSFGTAAQIGPVDAPSSVVGGVVGNAMGTPGGIPPGPVSYFVCMVDRTGEVLCS